MRRVLNDKNLKDILSTEEFYNCWCSDFEGGPWPLWMYLAHEVKESWRRLFVRYRREIVKD